MGFADLVLVLDRADVGNRLVLRLRGSYAERASMSKGQFRILIMHLVSFRILSLMRLFLVFLVFSSEVR